MSKPTVGENIIGHKINILVFRGGGGGWVLTPYDDALCSGINPPLSWAFTSAPFSSKNSATSTLLYPAGKKSKGDPMC